MYKENEILLLTQNVGVENTEGFIPKGSELLFLRAIDNPNDLSKSMLIVQFEDRQLALPELTLVPKEVNTIKALESFNKSLMDSKPELKIYHHNPFMRLLYTITNFFDRKFINPLRMLRENLTNNTTSDNNRDDLINEIKALMEDDSE